MESPKIDRIDLTDFLTPAGKRKRRKVNRLEQSLRFWQSNQDRANEVISTPKQPPRSREPSKPSYWWEKD